MPALRQTGVFICKTGWLARFNLMGNRPTLVADEFPAVADVLPAKGNHSPSVADELPLVVDQFPAVADGLPAKGNHSPSVADEPPAVVNELPRMAEGFTPEGEERPCKGNDSPRM